MLIQNRHKSRMSHSNKKCDDIKTEKLRRRQRSTVRRRPTLATASLLVPFSGGISENIDLKADEVQVKYIYSHTDDNPVLGIRTRLANFAIKLLAVVLYIARACIDQGEPYSVECCACTGNITHFKEHGIDVPEYYKSEDERKKIFHSDPYNFDWSLILKVCRQKEMWYSAF